MQRVLLLCVLVFLFVSTAHAQVIEERFQEALQRYMQCQSDNVATFRDQLYLYKKAMDALTRELRAAMDELSRLKDIPKGEAPK